MTGSVAEPTGELQGCIAEYDLAMNGKRIGSVVSELENVHSNHWHYQINSKARRGIIKASIKQGSQFILDGDQIRPLHFTSKQKVAFAKRASTAHYDWKSMTASGRHKKNNWEIAFQAGFVDRLTLNEQIRIDLAKQPEQQRFEYLRLDRGKLRPMVFQQQLEPITIRVPAGDFHTHLMQREHDSSERRTQSWHAPELNYLPVRMEQLDDGELTVTELRKVTGCRPKSENPALSSA